MGRENIGFPSGLPGLSSPLALNPSPKGPPVPRLVAYWMIALVSACGAVRADPIDFVENCAPTDSARGREVPLKIYYPQADRPGGYPVVIFSHGAGASKDSYGYRGASGRKPGTW